MLGSGQNLGAALAAASELQAQALALQGQAHAESVARQLEELNTKESGLIAESHQLKEALDLQERRIELNLASFDAARPLRAKGYMSDIQLRQREELYLDAQQAKLNLERQMADTAASMRQSCGREKAISCRCSRGGSSEPWSQRSGA
ncbi:hypothetical protein ACRAWD_04545 [Caulobacter segnis]